MPDNSRERYAAGDAAMHHCSSRHAPMPWGLLDRCGLLSTAVTESTSGAVPDMYSFSNTYPLNFKEFCMNLRPLNDRVIVKRLDQETKTASGLIIPDAAAENRIKAKSLP